MNSTKVLGISCYYHDSSVCYLKNNKIIYAIQEERLTRIKNDKSFPVNAIHLILSKEKMNISDFDAIVFYELPELKIKRIIDTFIFYEDNNSKKNFYEFYQNQNILENDIQKYFGYYKKERLIKIPHHFSHACSAYYPSPFEDSAIVVVDGVGEYATTSIHHGVGSKINTIKQINFPNSLGLLYSNFTSFLGFEVNEGEYKVMGLAPYGTPKYKNLIENELIKIFDDGSFKLNLDYFNFSKEIQHKNFEKIFKIEKRLPDSIFKNEHLDLAASIQSVFEECYLKIINKSQILTKSKNLSLAGGCALNCVANGKIIRSTNFEKIWVQPASNDAGSALGAAQYGYLKLSDNIGRKKINFTQSAYLGANYKKSEIENYLEKNNIDFNQCDRTNLLEFVSQKLVENKIVGWFQGKSEFGPRALGNRSILGNPLDPNAQANINLNVKFRESFRPFAPTVINEKVLDYFEFDNYQSDFMSFVAKIKENLIDKESIEKLNKEIDIYKKAKISKSKIPAVTHVDYTSRLQTLKRIDNELYYDLIKKFGDKTGYYLLLNTSFNKRGEPIVFDFKDAYDCFISTNIDILVIENFIIEDKKI